MGQIDHGSENAEDSRCWRDRENAGGEQTKPTAVQAQVWRPVGGHREDRERTTSERKRSSFKREALPVPEKYRGNMTLP
ncbi:hypothetical protein Q1695_009989 [Nippostrongylus brasiliensis]|nr:hypothetical protein Q1695_009989 [Nippostrongylus brasiliensis]